MATLDLAAGQRAAASAMAAVEKAAKKELNDALLASARAAAQKHATFTSDHVWVEFERLFPTMDVPEPRALGPQMLRAARRGFCESTGKTTRSQREKRHTGSVMVYRSLLCSTPAVKGVDALAVANARIGELEQEVVKLYDVIRRLRQRT